MYKKLRDLRNQKNIPASEMASIIGLKTSAAYYKKENGSIRFTLDEAKAIADRLECGIDEIFFDSKVA